MTPLGSEPVILRIVRLIHRVNKGLEASATRNSGANRGESALSDRLTVDDVDATVNPRGSPDGFERRRPRVTLRSEARRTSSSRPGAP
jgi:hypothetical protein